MESEQTGASCESLIRRAKMFIEDGEFGKADEYAERVLDIEPENAEMYVIKLLCDLQLVSLERLEACDKSFAENINYKRAVRFAGDELKKKLNACATSVEARVAAVKAEEARVAAAEQSAANAKKSKLAYYRCKFAKYEGKMAVNGSYLIVGENGEVSYYVDSEYRSWLYGCRSWKDISAVSLGNNFALGLKKDGTVVAVGNDEFIKKHVSDWRDIKTIVGANGFALGLTKDGRVYAAGKNDKGQCNVGDWHDVVAIAAGDDFSVGLKADGTVTSTSQYVCKITENWRNIVSVKASGSVVMGLKDDGTVALNRDTLWNDVVYVDYKSGMAVGVTAGGKVVYSYNSTGDWIFRARDYTDIIAVAAGGCDLLALHWGGAVYFTGYSNRCASQKVGRVFYTPTGRQKRIKELNDEKAKLNAELQGLKGLFTKKRRESIVARIDLLNAEINDLLKYGDE